MTNVTKATNTTNTITIKDPLDTTDTTDTLTWPYEGTMLGGGASTETISISNIDSIDTITLGSTIDPYIINGSGLTYNGASSLNWGESRIVAGHNKESALQVKGDTQIEGKLKVGGVDVGDALERIERRLNILRPSPELESRWAELKELGDKYRELEQEILAQEQIYEILKQ